MSADTEGLARFDTRRAVQTDEYSHQTDLRAIGVRERGQLALDELHTGAQTREASSAERPTETTRADVEAALGCARTTIDGLQERIQKLEAERDRLHEDLRAESER